MPVHCASLEEKLETGSLEFIEIQKSVPHVGDSKHFNDRSLKAREPKRSDVEYCWMFSSALPLHILEKNPGMDSIAYLDADMYFYASPEEIYKEFGTSSILLIPHGYSAKHKDREKMSGIYNVGMMIFKNDANALEALRWWKDRVVEWCFNRYENGKLGDQTYLNDWPTRFKGVYVLKHPGANVASWNIARFAFTSEETKFSGIELATGKKFELIFYHFHGLKIYAALGGRIRAYPVTVHDIAIYRRYLEALTVAYARLREIEPGWSFGLVKRLDILRFIKQYILLRYGKNPR